MTLFPLSSEFSIGWWWSVFSGIAGRRAVLFYQLFTFSNVGIKPIDKFFNNLGYFSYEMMILILMSGVYD